MKTLVVTLLGLSAAAAQTPPAPAPDACAPKPAQYPPALPAKLMQGMGTVHLPITTQSSEAQKFFDQGLAQMHSFWFTEAERSFRQAAALDPQAPMPHFGIAMVAAGDFRPRFQLDDGGGRRSPQNPRTVEAAKRAIELASVPGKATEIERLYIDAIAARRLKGGKQPEDAFARGLRTLLAKYPNEVEARTYLALMIMRGFVLPDRTPRHPTSTEAVEILRGLMKDAPNHPGVHHYVIHGFEGSTFANEAWHSCERYAALVPNIPHALHMPGHIYSQTARWQDAAKSFEAAAENERSYMRADSLYGSSHHGHNVHYLATSYAFSGNYEKAVEAARELLAIPENPAEAAALDNIRTAQYQGFFALLRTLVQFRKWDELLKADVLQPPAKPRAKAWHHWARAVAAASTGDSARAERESAAMDRALAEYRRIGSIHPSVRIARLELDAHLHLMRGNWRKAKSLFGKAIAKERALRYNEPPNYPRPVAEALGHAAMQRGEAATAETAFRTALEQFPADWHAESALRALSSTPVRAGL